MLIRIVKSPYSHGTTLEVNGRGVDIPPEGSTADLDEELLPALADSHIAYEIVGAADEAGEGAGGTLGDAPAEIAPEETPDYAEWLPVKEEPAVEETEEVVEVNPGVLDDNVPNIVALLPGLSPADLRYLLNAEKAGKTRVTLISALEEALNPPQE